MNSPYGLPCVENCLTCHLRSESFFCDLPKESLAAFNEVKYPAVYPAHSVIFLEGQTSRGIFMLCQGQAKLSTTSKDGKILILRMARAGDVLGLDAAITGRPHDLTLETMQPCQLDFVGREDFLSLLKNHGEICLRVAQHISRDYRDACDVVRAVGLSRSISQRLAKFLLESSEGGRIANGVVSANLGLTHEDISQLIGTSRETITRTLAEFRRREIVELRGATLIVHNKIALGRLVAS